MPILRSPDAAAVASPVRERRDLPLADTWNLHDIFPTWEAWDAACAQLEADIREYAALKGSLARGADALLTALRRSDELSQVVSKVYYFASLHYDEDQRSNEMNGRRQRVQLLHAQWRQAASWFSPELLA